MPKKISDDATCVAAAWFPGQNLLKFNMVVNKPSARAQAGLDELVLGGYIMRASIPGEPNAQAYKPLQDLSWCRVWFMANKDKANLDFNLLEPLP